MITINDVPKGMKRKLFNATGMLGSMTFAHFPSRRIRKLFYTLCGTKIGKNSVIFRNAFVMWPIGLTIDAGSSIGRDTIIDARGGITIGKNVTVAGKVNLITGSHDINDKDFSPIFKPIIIEDYAWICTGATIIQGVTIGRGSVVCAGAVVTSDVPDMTVVGGVPAKKIKERKVQPTFVGRKSPILH